MNADKHTLLSCKSSKSKDQVDYDFFYKIHDFFDSSKEIESSNRHRIFLHSMWAVKRVIIPIFGSSYTCKNGRVVNIKDDCEQNHLLADFKFKFIPNLSDYVSLIEDDYSDRQKFKDFEVYNSDLFEDEEVRDLMVSPLAIAGEIKSLWITHNSWFLGTVLPKIFKGKQFKIKDYGDFSPTIIFNRMKYADWLQNGSSYPPSLEKIKEHRNKENYD